MSGSARRAALVVALVATGAGCGGAHRATPPPPKLPHELAAQLATLSDGVAAQLDSGNDCAALTSARQLETQTIAAIDGSRVPLPLQQPLRNAADDLVSRIRCTPQQRGEHGKGNEHGKHKGHDGGGD